MKIEFSRIPNIPKLLQKNFIAGLFVVAPIAVIFWLGWVALQSIGDLSDLLPTEWKPENQFLEYLFSLAALMVIALGISFAGWVSKQVIGQKLFEMVGEAISRIPIFRSVYGSLEQLMKTFATGGGTQFSRVVYVEYPRKDVWTLAFVTSQSNIGNVLKSSDQHRQFASEKFLSLYVPTTPNPTSGFYIIARESDTIEANMKVDEALRTILSLGMVSKT